MTLSYFTYYFDSEKDKFVHPLNPLIKCFTQVGNAKFRGSFSHNDESIYLFNVSQNFYLFVKTKNKEIIKTVNRNKIEHYDIYNKLQQSNEELGFASYIYISDSYYCILSTLQGPKNGVWVEFINNLLRKLELKSHMFICEPMPVETTADEVMNFHAVTGTVIKINQENNFFKKIAGMLALSLHETRELVIEIKAHPKSDMNLTFRGINSNIGSEGITKYMVRAKAELDDNITEFYLIGQGYVSDTIDGRFSDAKLHEKVKNKINHNQLLQEKLREYNEDKRYRHESIQDITFYHNLSNWDSILSTY